MRGLFAIGIVLIISTNVTAQVAAPIKFTEETFDFGNVVEENGPVSHEFTFTNTSTRPIQILAVKPSCGCTTPGWTKEPIMPGKTGSIKAQFDPKGRPGFFNKSLTVTTDFDNQPIIFQIKGTVVSKDKNTHADLLAASGNLRLRSLSFNFSKIYRNDEFVVREFEVINAGTKPVTYANKVEGPPYIRVSIEPVTIPAGEKATIKVSYNGKQSGRYGFQSDNIVIHTNDELLPNKSFTVYATLEDYFPQLTPSELSKAPQLRFANQSVDFGSMKQNQPETKEILVINSGKSPLEIRSVIGNCTCIQASVDKSMLKAGESTALKITFNPQDRKGTQTKSVTVYSNDPKNPVQRITLTGVVD